MWHNLNWRQQQLQVQHQQTSTNNSQHLTTDSSSSKVIVTENCSNTKPNKNLGLSGHMECSRHL